MPGITLTISGQPDAALASTLAAQVTALTATVLDKNPATTMVITRFVPYELWFIDSRSLAEHGRNSFRLEVTITDETVTRAQKIRYQREAFELLSGLIGNLHTHSNVHIIDTRAVAYGYGGITQEQRLQPK